MARHWERENGRGKSAQSEITGYRQRQRRKERRRQRQRQPAPKLPKSFDKFVGQPTSQSESEQEECELILGLANVTNAGRTDRPGQLEHL